MRDTLESKDVVSRWLQAAESHGECLDILFGRGNPQTQAIDWYGCSHLHYDGLGAFAHILSDAHNIPISIPMGQFPVVARTEPALTPVTPDPTQKAVLSRLKPCSTAVNEWLEKGLLAWHHFSLEASQMLQARARQSHCSVNSLLLHSLNSSLCSENEFGSHFTWLIPVNLRGALSARRPSSNQVSYLHHTVRRPTCVHATHRELRAQLQAGVHWRQYRRMRSLCRLPLFLRKWILKRQRAKRALPTGTFSNLGQWDSALSLKKEHFWLFCPPLASNHQVAAGSVCFQNQISLVLRLAPDAPLAQKPAKHWMQYWRDSLSQQAST